MNDEIKRINLWKVFMVMLVLTPFISASLNVQLSDQGTGVVYTNGTALGSGDLTVLIYTSSSGGTLIYNETFSDAISNGSWNVMLGSGVNLSLEFGKIYYKDYLIAGENASFDGLDRQAFYSPLGDINGSDLANDFYINTTGNLSTTGIGFFSFLGDLVSRITSLFVQDIDFSGIISGDSGEINITSNTGNIETSGNITFSEGSNQSQIYLKGGELIIEY